MSKRVLLIKLTSMGDLMHALPALTDATHAIPGIQFDWVVDEAFAEVPSWHPAVNQIICSAHRRWKKQLGQSIFGGQLSKFYRQLNHSDYDVILDAQNNIKSAVISGLRRGKIHGLSKQSISEAPASWAYRYPHDADKDQHAIARQRLLFSEAIGYDLPQTAPDYGIDRSLLQLPDIELPERFLFFVHNASWTTKLWPEPHWHALIKQAAEAGYKVLLPCGNDEELARAQRLAQQHSNATALPKLSLSHVGGIMNKAAGVVTCDTGLCHLAGMLGLPSVSFYGPTSDQLIGATGLNQQHIIASSEAFSCAPCYGRRCTKDGADSEMSDCMDSFLPEQVWQSLTELMAKRC
ncbi:lipopolysaccharide heptosyltransferase I [Oceanicoccus sagamiensis]|uniref:Lipopolysaccharide heptosyltransferase 1 n=1 Tax=Oceanicoccus sagamiensis TaxID=716816 RepID=A0A1X9NH61_9GAMM|nr:lipopolysaccharide heptosyltransferase I [Oceanicoccus sagamiensis]ARN74849.1 lipopolysaccharide heptosyltransferase I [Oceanicoccus sagamiensis]